MPSEPVALPLPPPQPDQPSQPVAQPEPPVANPHPPVQPEQPSQPVAQPDQPTQPEQPSQPVAQPNQPELPVAFQLCGRDVADIILNVQFVADQAKGKSMPAVLSVPGAVHISQVLGAGVELQVPGDVKTNQLRMVLASDGNFLVLPSGEQVSLVLASQDNSGFKLRLGANQNLVAGHKYLLRATQAPGAIDTGHGCKLDENWQGVSLTEVGN